jgi:hypothetical protein
MLYDITLAAKMLADGKSQLHIVFNQQYIHGYNLRHR